MEYVILSICPNQNKRPRVKQLRPLIIDTYETTVDSVPPSKVTPLLTINKFGYVP